VIEDDGLDELIGDLGKAGYTAAKRAQTVVAKTSQDIVALAQQLVPVDTSATKNSIDADFSPDGLAAEMGPTTHYAWYLEHGTSKMAPHAFMGPALDRHTPGFVDAMRQLGAEF
jgi:HK97 gp10 family phage protein